MLRATKENGTDVKHQSQHWSHSCIRVRVTCGMRRLTYGLNSLLPGLTPNVLSRPKDGGLLVALFDSVLRASVIFTIVNQPLKNSQVDCEQRTPCGNLNGKNTSGRTPLMVSLQSSVS